MFFTYFLAFFAFIPILAYLLSQNTNNKGYIFGISFLVIIFCLFTVVGKYSFLGSIQKQKINTEILMNIRADKKISENNLCTLFLSCVWEIVPGNLPNLIKNKKYFFYFSE